MSIMVSDLLEYRIGSTFPLSTTLSNGLAKGHADGYPRTYRAASRAQPHEPASRALPHAGQPREGGGPAALDDREPGVGRRQPVAHGAGEGGRVAGRADRRVVGRA